ncbi:chemotaxis protein MotB [uncultured Gammaproteobacteria bacterium]
MAQKGGEGGGGGLAPIIVIKKKKAGHAAAHGGAWKVAYADFVTAMMAFFLLLWLLNVVTSDQKKGIADYFAPAAVSRSQSGSGGAMGGRSISQPGAMLAPASEHGSTSPSSLTPGFSAGEDDTDETADPSFPKPQPGETREDYRQRLDKLARDEGIDGQKSDESLRKFGERVGVAVAAHPKPRNDENNDSFQRRIEQIAQQLGLPSQKPGEALQNFAERVAQAAAQMIQGQQDAQQFLEAASSIRQAIQSVPELQELAKSLMVDQTPEGLRIQIVDQERLSMFPAGSNQMFPQTSELMRLVAKAIGTLPNKLSISGHTDSTPFNRVGRDNWDLSTERANASRRALIAGGIDESRIATVVGKADREPFDAKDPNSARNRRIGIVLLRSPAPAAGAQPSR